MFAARRERLFFGVRSERTTGCVFPKGRGYSFYKENRVHVAHLFLLFFTPGAL
jgi:hypothetical protein